LQLPQRDERWHVVLKHPKDTPCTSCSVVAIERGKQTKHPKVVGAAEIDGEPSAEQICKFLVKTMLQQNEGQVNGKPTKISFDNERVYEDVTSYLQNDGTFLKGTITSSGIVFIQEPPEEEAKSLWQHFKEFKKLAEIKLGNENQLNGITLKLVKKKGDTTTTTEAGLRFEIPKSKPTIFETILKIILGLCFTFFVSTFILPSLLEGSGSGAWPISPELSQKLRLSLYSILQDPQDHYAASAIADAIEYHDGKKALSLNLVGNVDNKAEIIVGVISRALFGNEISDRVLVLQQGLPELVIKSKIVRNLKQWPLSIIIMEYKNMRPDDYSFLTSALDGNFPLVELDGDQVKTNQAIFIFVFDILQEEIAGLSKKELQSLDLLVKNQMKMDDWPARIIQRIDYVIPFF